MTCSIKICNSQSIQSDYGGVHICAASLVLAFAWSGKHDGRIYEGEQSALSGGMKPETNGVSTCAKKRQDSKGEA